MYDEGTGICVDLDSSSKQSPSFEYTEYQFEDHSYLIDVKESKNPDEVNPTLPPLFLGI